MECIKIRSGVHQDQVSASRVAFRLHNRCGVSSKTYRMSSKTCLVSSICMLRQCVIYVLSISHVFVIPCVYHVPCNVRLVYSARDLQCVSQKKPPEQECVAEQGRVCCRTRPKRRAVRGHKTRGLTTRGLTTRGLTTKPRRLPQV